MQVSVLMCFSGGLAKSEIMGAGFYINLVSVFQTAQLEVELLIKTEEEFRVKLVETV